MAKTIELIEVAAAPAAYPVPANASFAFNSRSLLVINEDTTPANIVYVSFDGATDHAKLVPGTPSAGLRLERQPNDGEVWVRGVGTPNVTLIAED